MPKRTRLRLQILKLSELSSQPSERRHYFCNEILSSGKLAESAAKALKFNNISDAKAFQISDAKAPAAKAFRT